MTKGQIKQAVNDAIDAALPNVTDTQTLSETENVAATDAAAEVLETVNPNHNYPTTNK